jgi:pimeloyl-ACP methyl ester carboxylesterase
MTTPESPTRPAPLRATAADLPPAVAAALADPTPGQERHAAVDGVNWRALAWGSKEHPPVVLVHGVTSNAETFWRIGPAIAASGRHVVAPDLPGHGSTGGWAGRHRFAQTAEELAAFIRVPGLDRPDLAVLGHSWGGMLAAHLPAAGLRPGRIILEDPPALPVEMMELMTHDPVERPYPTLDEARRVVRGLYPDWADGDVAAKARGIQSFDAEAVRSILVDNGDWDAGLRALADPAASGIPVWLIRGEVETGGMIPDQVLPAFDARIGADHVITIAGAPHSPQRTHPEALVLAILRALEG